MQTKGGVSSNPWVDYVRKCAKEYKSSKEQAKEQAKGTASKEQRTVEEWENRKQDVNKKQSHANMKRSGEIARKAEQDLVRKRLTSKQKENHLVRKRLTTKQKDPNSPI